MVFNATFKNISLISWWSVFIGGGNRSTQRKPQTCRKSLTNFITYGLYIAHNIVIYFIQGVRKENLTSLKIGTGLSQKSFSVPLTSFFNDVKICVTSYFMYGKYCTFNKILAEPRWRPEIFPLGV